MAPPFILGELANGMDVALATDLVAVAPNLDTAGPHFQPKCFTTRRQAQILPTCGSSQIIRKCSTRIQRRIARESRITTRPCRRAVDRFARESATHCQSATIRMLDRVYQPTDSGMLFSKSRRVIARCTASVIYGISVPFMPQLSSATSHLSAE